MPLIHASVLIALALPTLVAQAESPPAISPLFLSRAPFVLRNIEDKLEIAPPNNDAIYALAELREKYSVDINRDIIAGLLLFDPIGPDPLALKGLNLQYVLRHPLIRPHFSNAPELWIGEDPQYVAEIKEIYSDLLHNDDSEYKDIKTSPWSFADASFNFALLGKRERDILVYDPKNNSFRSYISELAFHEAMHVFHRRKLGPEVERILKLPGGFYERRAALREECPTLIAWHGQGHGFDSTAKNFCGYKSRAELTRAYAAKYKIPQRYGEALGLMHLSPDTDCWSGENEFLIARRLTIASNKFCHRFGPEDTEDIHAFSSGSEYFAIMIQALVFYPQEFERVALPEEKKFFREVLDKHLSTKSRLPVVRTQATKTENPPPPPQASPGP